MTYIDTKLNSKIFILPKEFTFKKKLIKYCYNN